MINVSNADLLQAEVSTRSQKSKISLNGPFFLRSASIEILVDPPQALIAERAKDKGVSKVAFDRSGFKYHGRIKALADAARENGLKF